MNVEPLELYNTASHALEVMKPLVPGSVSLYCCGPTVYNYSHIGNFRAFLFEDILRRTLRHSGYTLQHVMNITDVGHLQSDGDEGDDKMLVASRREAKSPWDIAKYYTQAFFDHSKLLNIETPDIVCKATDHIADMIHMVQKLIDKGHAYEANGNVYFDITSFENYSVFANLQLDAQQTTDRVNQDANKRNQADFCLWFSQSKYPHQIMKWDSPWGTGFPGWHIECSAMANTYLGEQFDIHCGGIDHIPVHHTNEIAQSDCYHGHKTVNVWMHCAFLTVDSAKMSKSTGNFITVQTLIDDGFHPLAYRYWLLGGHYRSQLKFSYEALGAAENALYSLHEKIQDWQSSGASAETTDPSHPAVQLHLATFWAALRKDLHTPKALSEVWAVVKSTELDNAQKLYLLKAFDVVLGIDLANVTRTALSNEEQTILDARQHARSLKNWAESDRFRDELLKRGIAVKDTPDGTEWSRVKPQPLS